jgi:hypothetical protein
MRVTTLVLATVALALIVAGDAAAQWSAPQRLGPGLPADLGFTPAGRGLLVLASSTLNGPSRAAAAGTAGRPSAPYRLTRGSDGYGFGPLDHHVALFGRDRVVATGMRFRRGRTIVRPWVAFGRIGRPLGPRRPLPVAGYTGGSLQVVANARGDVAILASTCAGCVENPLFLLVRPRGEGFRRPVRLTSRGDDRGDFAAGVAPALAINDRGDVLVAYGRGRRVFPPEPGAVGLYARVRRDGRWLTRPQRMGNLLEYGAIRAEITRGGRSAVAWWTEHGDTGGAGVGPLEPPEYWVSTGARDGRFDPPAHLDTGTANARPDFPVPDIHPARPAIEAALTPGGRLRLAWTGAVGTRSVARTATLVDGEIRQRQQLGEGDVLGLASDGRDRAVTLWSGAVLNAAVAERAAPYADESELVARQPVPATDGAVAIVPGSGRVLAAWGTDSGVRWAVRSRLPGDAAPAR